MILIVPNAVLDILNPSHRHLKTLQISFMFRLRAHSTEEYAVVLDYLQFDNDMAFNFLISQTDIHTTLVLTDDQAEHLV